MSFLNRLADLLEMIKFSHTVFALPFAIMAAFLAQRETSTGYPAPLSLTLIVLAMITARSAAMAFNRLVDAPWDARNPRTAGRHIPAGRLTPATVAAFTAATAAAFVGVCALFDVVANNPWPLWLSPVVLAWLLGYSLAKRFTSLTHFWLGLALGLSPLATFIALRGTPHDTGLAPEAFALTAAVFFWTAGFDLIYACQDVDFDRHAGLHSVPAYLGVVGALWIARLCHLLTLAALGTVGLWANLGPIYAVGVSLAAALLIYEHALISDWRLARPDLAAVNVAFFTINGIVSLVVAALTIADILYPLGWA